MRHGKKINHLGRTSSHRKAMLSNMSASLILHKRISTTLAKAKALRVYVEPLLTKSKQDTTHSRRIAFSYLQDKEAATILFRDVAPKIANRPGGYTRIIKLANRLGDNAEMCIIELVDFNELMLKDKTPKKAATTRRGRGSKKKEGASETAVESAGNVEENTSEASTENTDAVKVKAPKAKAKAADKTEEKTAETKPKAKAKSKSAENEGDENEKSKSE